MCVYRCELHFNWFAKSTDAFLPQIGDAANQKLFLIIVYFLE